MASVVLIDLLLNKRWFYNFCSIKFVFLHRFRIFDKTGFIMLKSEWRLILYEMGII